MGSDDPPPFVLKDAGLEAVFEVGVAEVDHALLGADPETDTEFSITEEVDWLDVESDDCCSLLLTLGPPILDVENDEGSEALEPCDTDDAVVLVEANPLVPALPWQPTGTETGVASTAAIDVVVLMVRERPSNAG